MYPELPQEPQSSWRTHKSWYFGVFIFAALLFIAVLFWVNANFVEEYFNSQDTSQISLKKEEPIKITIDLNDGKAPRIFKGSEMPNLTLGDAVQEIASFAGYKILTSNNVLTSLTGRSTKERPVLYVNGARQGDTVRLDVLLNSGDNLLIRYESNPS